MDYMDTRDFNVHTLEGWIDYMIKYNKDDLKYMIDFSPDGEEILEYITLVKCLCPICFSELMTVKEGHMISERKYYNDSATHYCSNELCEYKNIFN